MYRLDYGPVPSDFGAPKPFHPFGVVFDFPLWAHFDIFTGANSSVMSLNGAWYYQVEAKVSGFIAPYPGIHWVDPLVGAADVHLCDRQKAVSVAEPGFRTS